MRLAIFEAGLICAMSGIGAGPLAIASSPNSFSNEPSISFCSFKSLKVVPGLRDFPSPSKPSGDSGCSEKGVEERPSPGL